MGKLKNFLAGTAAGIILITSMAAAAFAAGDDISVIIDGKNVEFDVQPMIIEDRTMVPLRAIFEALDATVAWNPETQTVISYKGDITVVMQIGNPVITKNGQSYTLDVAPQIIEDRTLVPVRAVAESFNTNVTWDQNTKTVSITTTDTGRYDDISANITQIEDFIDRGLYLEAIEECDRAESWYNLSPQDSNLIDELRSAARNKYDEYERNTQGRRQRAFESLKNTIIQKGYSNDDGYFILESLDAETVMSISYSVSEDKIIIIYSTQQIDYTSLNSIDIENNNNPPEYLGGMTIDGYDFVTHGTFSSDGNKLVIDYSNALVDQRELADSFCELCDAVLELIGSDVRLSDFDIAYDKN